MTFKHYTDACWTAVICIIDTRNYLVRLDLFCSLSKVMYVKLYNTVFRSSNSLPYIKRNTQDTQNQCFISYSLNLFCFFYRFMNSILSYRVVFAVLYISFLGQWWVIFLKFQVCFLPFGLDAMKFPKRKKDK